MSKLLLVLVGSIFLVGCAPFVLNVQDPIPSDVIRFNADRVEVVLTADVEPTWRDPFSGRPVPFDEEIQTQLHELVLRNAASPIVAAESGTEKTVIVQISRAVIMVTMQGIKSVPFVGILAFNMKEELSVIIEGYVEIEDNQGLVISSAPIRVNARQLSGDPEGINKIIEDALLLLQDEIIQNSRRYLHAHLL